MVLYWLEIRIQQCISKGWFITSITFGGIFFILGLNEENLSHNVVCPTEYCTSHKTLLRIWIMLWDWSEGYLNSLKFKVVIAWDMISLHTHPLELSLMGPGIITSLCLDRSDEMIDPPNSRFRIELEYANIEKRTTQLHWIMISSCDPIWFSNIVAPYLYDQANVGVVWSLVYIIHIPIMRISQLLMHARICTPRQNRFNSNMV